MLVLHKSLHNMFGPHEPYVSFYVCVALPFRGLSRHLTHKFFERPPPPSPNLALLRHNPAVLLLHRATALTTPQLLQLHALLLTSPPPLPPDLIAVKLITAAPPRHSLLLFSLLPAPNIFIHNSLLHSLSSHRLFPLTIRHFNRLLRARHPLPDAFTFTSLLKSCTALGSVPDGDKSHAYILKRGYASNLCVRNSLIDMEFKFNRPVSARHLFDQIPLPDTVSYNTLLSGYVAAGDPAAAREVFDKMGLRSMVTWSAMIAGHARFGDVAAARALFDGMAERNVVCWNAMIAGYAQNERFAEAIKLFRAMMWEGCVVPNGVTLVSVLSACAHLGALELGRWVEGYIQRRKMGVGLFLGNALSDMYAKCGCLDDARRVFDGMRDRDEVSWSIIISGEAMYGHAEEAMSAFREMLRDGIEPNEITFMGILSACTHAGLVDAGLEYFNIMIEEFGILPKVEQYGCVVDLLSRAGRLDEAEKMINSMTVPPNVIVWGSLLGGCRIHRDIARGEWVVQRILELDPNHSGSHVYMANMCASTGRLEDAAMWRSRLRERHVGKTPGCSWIEVDNTVYEFFMGDRSHPRSDEIYWKISSLSLRMRQAGYIPNTSMVTQSMDEEEKADVLSMHSERLAVAFGLISTREGSTIRVVKNLRVCNDCHDAMKVISKIVGREIILRDRSRFHQFKDGECSCKDYW